MDTGEIMNNTYHSSVYGTGEIIARSNGEIIVRFDAPPGMKQIPGPRVVPVVHFADVKR